MEEASDRLAWTLQLVVCVCVCVCEKQVFVLEADLVWIGRIYWPYPNTRSHVFSGNVGILCEDFIPPGYNMNPQYSSTRAPDTQQRKDPYLYFQGVRTH